MRKNVQMRTAAQHHRYDRARRPGWPENDATHIDMPEVRTLLRPAMEKMFVVTTESYRHAPNLLYADVVLPRPPLARSLIRAAKLHYSGAWGL